MSLVVLTWSIRVLKTQKNAGLKYRIRWRRKRNEDLLDSSRKLIATLEARILEAEKIGMKLTENYSMMPAASVSGLYFANKKSKYFSVH